MKLTRAMLVALDAWASVERRRVGMRAYVCGPNTLATKSLAVAGLIDIGPGARCLGDVALTPTGELVLAAYRLGRGSVRRAR